MPKVKFVENKYIKPPYTSLDVRFENYGEEQDVTEEIAIRLLKKFPYAFVSKEITVEDDTKEDANKVAIRFVQNKFLDSYTYKTNFFANIGDVLDVPVQDARHMLEKHPDKFVLVDDPNEEEKKKEAEMEQIEELVEEESVEEAIEAEDIDKNVDDISEGTIEYDILQALGDEKLKMSDIADRMGTSYQSIRVPIAELVEVGVITMEEVEDDNGMKVKMYSVVKE